MDLVLTGLLHVQVGPSPVVGENGKIGYSYTNGTTGGAAYALAFDSKLPSRRRGDAGDLPPEQPVGVQAVVVRTTGDFRVGPYPPLDFAGPGKTPAGPVEATGDGRTPHPS